ncbi:hypothetical protein MTO96_051350 [Rhipicephalus appendiculatus]
MRYSIFPPWPHMRTLPAKVQGSKALRRKQLQRAADGRSYPYCMPMSCAPAFERTGPYTQRMRRFPAAGRAIIQRPGLDADGTHDYSDAAGKALSGCRRRIYGHQDT